MKVDQRLLLGWWYGWVGDLLRLGTGHRDPQLTNPDKRAALQRLAGRLQSRRLHEFLQQLARMRALVDTTVNPQLMLESLLIRWIQLARRP
jgi:DNA polymerase-3 subunit delta'